MSSEISVGAQTAVRSLPSRALRSTWKALRSPGLVTQLMRAQWQLRRCQQVPLTVRMRGRAFVENHGRIEIGERVRFEGRMVPVEMVAWGGASLRVGEGTFINYGVSLSAHQDLSIGRDCLIGNYVVIMDGDYHDLVDRSQPGKFEPIVIEDNVWLGIRTTVLKGVRIGQGSVIGAGSVVTNDIPSQSLAMGVPARVIRKL